MDHKSRQDGLICISPLRPREGEIQGLFMAPLSCLEESAILGPRPMFSVHSSPFAQVLNQRCVFPSLLMTPEQSSASWSFSVSPDNDRHQCFVPLLLLPCDYCSDDCARFGYKGYACPPTTPRLSLSAPALTLTSSSVSSVPLTIPAPWYLPFLLQ